MLSIKTNGDWSKSFDFLEKIRTAKLDRLLNKAGERGRVELFNNTPKDTWLAASSWSYEIEKGRDSATITWHNDDIEGGFNVALLIQYGHGKKGGGYVQGRDYINPSIQSVFEELADDIWKEVSKL